MGNNKPKYRMIVDDIKSKVANAEWLPNRVIPSQTELAELYETSEITSRRALSELVNEGIIYRVRGKGSFVKGNGKTDSRESLPAKTAASAAEGALASERLPLRRIYLIHNLGDYVQLFDHPFHGDLFRGLQEEAARREIEFRTWDYSLDADIPFEPQAGYVISTMNDESFTAERIKQWLEDKRKIVTVHSYFPQTSIPYVIIDNMTGGYLATQHLLSLGHRRIGILLTGRSLADLNQEFSLRLQGYRLALNLQRISLDPELVHVVDGQNESQEQGEQGFRYFFGLADPPTAIFATSDLKAHGLLRSARLRGISVPEELSLVGYDNMTFTQFTGLTTVSQNSFTMGKRAVEILCSDREEQTGGMSLKDEIVPELIVRQSTAPLG